MWTAEVLGKIQRMRLSLGGNILFGMTIMSQCEPIRSLSTRIIGFTIRIIKRSSAQMENRMYYWPRRKDGMYIPKWTIKNVRSPRIGGLKIMSIGMGFGANGMRNLP